MEEEAQPLTEDELAERDDLLAGGFNTWTRRWDSRAHAMDPCAQSMCPAADWRGPSATVIICPCTLAAWSGAAYCSADVPAVLQPCLELRTDTAHENGGLKLVRQERGGDCTMSWQDLDTPLCQPLNHLIGLLHATALTRASHP